MGIPKGILLLPDLKRTVQRHQHTFISLRIWRLFTFLITISQLSRPLSTSHLKEDQHTAEYEAPGTETRKGPSYRDVSLNWERPQMLFQVIHLDLLLRDAFKSQNPAYSPKSVARGCGTGTPRREQPPFLCWRWGPLFSLAVANSVNPRLKSLSAEMD